MTDEVNNPSHYRRHEMGELKPCPFCGSVYVSLVVRHADPDEGADWVGCRGCGASQWCSDTGAEAVEAWNQRALQEARDETQTETKGTP